MIHPSDGRTDGQTDGTAIAYTHYSIYAVARKKVHFYCFLPGALWYFARLLVCNKWRLLLELIAAKSQN